MKTDQPIYLYLNAGPEAFRVLTGGIDLQGVGIFLHAGQAPRFPRRIAGTDSPVRTVYLDRFLPQVMLFWFLERFRELTAKEVWSMLSLLTPIEETRGYQSIKAEGKTEGKAEALTGLLTRRFGPLPAWAVARIAKASIAQLDVWLDGIFDTRDLTDLLGRESEPPAH